jgi:hypothetical protein
MELLDITRDKDETGERERGRGRGINREIREG